MTGDGAENPGMCSDQELKSEAAPNEKLASNPPSASNPSVRSLPYLTLPSHLPLLWVPAQAIQNWVKNG